MEFKVGDRVRYLKNDYGNEYLMGEGTIQYALGRVCGVKMDLDQVVLSAFTRDPVEIELIDDQSEESVKLAKLKNRSSFSVSALRCKVSSH